MSIYIIAEIGINANGSRALALDMMKMAKDCGCDAVKFQKRDIWTVYSDEMLASSRQSPWGDTQLDQKAALEFDREDYRVFFSEGAEMGLDIFASAWDLKSLEFLENFAPIHHKIASAMLTHDEFVKTVAHLGRHTFISTGMSSEETVDKVVDYFKKANCLFTLMHCVSTYPCPECDLNLSMIPKLKEKYGCKVGYSGHEVGIWTTLFAVALGAEAIERHITIDRAMYGSDQAASIERKGLRILVDEIRGRGDQLERYKAIAKSLGDGEKRVLPQEMDAASKLRYWRE